jgi:hypothetical protein
LLPVVVNGSPVGDADLFVSNAHDGIVDVTKENCIWKSTNIGYDAVFLHPSDPNINRGSYFIVGVFGNSDVNEFELSVSSQTPSDVVDITTDTRFDFTLTSNYTYFRIDLDQLRNQNRNQQSCFSITVVNADNPKAKDGSLPSEEPLERNFGSTIYTNDSCPIVFESGRPALNKLIQPEVPLPLPVVFASTSCMFPTAENYTWKAAASNGVCRFEIEFDEIKYLSSFCYFSVVGLTTPGHTLDAVDLRCVVHSKFLSHSRDVTLKGIARRKLMETLFSDVDSEAAAFTDRAGVRLDDSSFTYGDVDYCSFQNLLKTINLTDGLIFYDLGSGIGKAIIAAAFSEIHFQRCIGIESLPSLAALSQSIIDRAQKLMGANSHSHRSPVTSGRAGFAAPLAANVSRSDIDGIAMTAGFDSILPLMEIR